LIVPFVNIETMMLGHGIDIEDVASMDALLKHAGQHFIQRCFVQSELTEINQGSRPTHYIAGAYAIKEAILKALGTGFADGVAYCQIQLHGVRTASPSVSLSGRALEVADAIGIVRWWVSVSVGTSLVVASAIAEGPDTSSSNRILSGRQ
jgi:holo-[acyl-carrier protein] synthase